MSLPIKRYILVALLSLMVALGLLWAYYALAQGPESVTYSSYVDYRQNTLFNTPGFPDEKGWETYVESQRPKTHLGAYSSSVRCSCVLFAKAYTGINPGSVGLAKYWPVNSPFPVTGAIVVFAGGYTGHVAVVTQVTDTTISLIESNYSRCAITTRTILKTQTNILGYYIP